MRPCGFRLADGKEKTSMTTRKGRGGAAFIAVLMLCLVPGEVSAQEWDWHLWVANEVSLSRPRPDSLFNPQGLFLEPHRAANDLFSSARLSRKAAGGRIRLQVSAGQRLNWEERVHQKLMLREAYGVFTLNDHLDLSVGKKMLRWGTGYAYNPSGFADPPKDVTDPGDRLDQRLGTELIQANYVRGEHSVDLVYFAPRLYFTRDPILDRDRLALRYNRLWRGLDFSGMALLSSGQSARLGGNLSYVVGRSLALHGELALSRPGTRLVARTTLLEGLGILPESQRAEGPVVQSVLGGAYSLPSGWTFIAEWHHDGEGLTGLQNRALYRTLDLDSRQAAGFWESGDPEALLALGRLLKAAGLLSQVQPRQDTLFSAAIRTWGRERFSLQVVGLTQLQDGSSILVPHFGMQVRRHWQLYFRHSAFFGSSRSQYGSLPYSSTSNLGLRYNF
jgi:hypothetical protein